jgi:hypothetical protein
LPSTKSLHRLEPAAKAAAGIVSEIAKFPRQLQQNVLYHVFRVGILQIPPPTPAIDVPTVMINKLVPGSVVQRVVAQPAKQSCTGRRK